MPAWRSTFVPGNLSFEKASPRLLRRGTSFRPLPISPLFAARGERKVASSVSLEGLTD